MSPSDRNPAKASFSSPPVKIVAKKSRSSRNYPRHTSFELTSSPAQEPSTLQDCIAHSFPDTNPTKLERWIHRIAAETPVEAELLLFVVFICAVQFRITHPEVRAVLGELWTWLTQYPRSMDRKLAELIIETIEPGLAQAIERRGWQRGLPDGPYIRKKGAPPKNRGAWVAGLLVDDRLRHAGVKGQAASLAAALVSVLLGRDVETNEFYRIKKPMDQKHVKKLVLEIVSEYEHWLKQDSVRIGDSGSTSSQGTPEYDSWRERHRPLTALLQDFPGEQLAMIALKRIAPSLWDPLWGPEYA